MIPILLRHVTVVDPEGPLHLQQVSIEVSTDGLLTIRDQGIPDDDFQEIDAEGTYISPGWVDIGVHLQDPGHEWIETQSALAKAALRGGFTTLLPYPSTIPVPENAEMIRALRAGFSQLPVNVFPLGAATEHLDGKEMAGLFEMHEAGAVGFSDGPVAISKGSTLLRLLSYLRSFQGLLLQGGISKDWLIEGHMHEGLMSTSLGLPGIPDMVELSQVQQTINTLEYLGEGKVHFHPLSTPSAIEAAHAAATQGMDITTGVPAYLFAFSDEDLIQFDEKLKVIPPLRSLDLQRGLKEQVAAGKIQIICSGHRAQGIEEKHVEFLQAEPGMHNVITAFSQVVSGLMESGYLSKEQWVSMISLNPRKRFGLEPAHISSGANDWTWFDTEANWELNQADLPSRAKNSPFLGQSLTGKVKGVGVKGQRHMF